MKVVTMKMMTLSDSLQLVMANLQRKKSELWLICDIFDGCVCPKSFPKGFDENDDFCCNKCSAEDI